MKLRLRALALPSSLAAVACGSPQPPAARASLPALAPPAAVLLPVAPVPAPPMVDGAFIRAYADSRGFRRGAPTAARLTRDGKAVLFLRSGAHDGRQSLFEMDVAAGATRELLSPEALDREAEHLTLEERARRERMRITSTGFASFLLSKDGRTVVVSLSGKLYALDRTSGRTHVVDVGKGAAIDPQLSPDGKLLAFVQNDDVHVVPVDGPGKARALTHGGTDAKPHGLADFCASEELFRYRGYWWSPDSKAVLWEEADATKLERLTIADPGHPENPADVVPYPRAGHANALLRFGITRVAAPGATTWVEWDREHMVYASKVVWAEHAPPTLVVLDRAQKNEAVLLVDPATGKTREVLREHDDAWLNVDPSVPAWLDDGSAFVWKSDRDGTARYGLVSAAGAATAKAPPAVRWLTPPGMQAEEATDVDVGRQTLTFVGTSDAVHREVMRISLRGGEVEPVARVENGSVGASFEEGLHEVFLAYEDSMTGPARVVVRARDGRVLHEVPSVAEVPPLPHVELTTAGPDAMHVAIVRPRSWVPGATYPVIDAAYGGPLVQVVGTNAVDYLLSQWMADATGAIVVGIDAKGTPARGRAWERVLLDHLGNVPLAGHVAAIQALVATHPEMDGSRVGVYGWSFGGYFSSLAVLERPDVYRAGVAIAPVVDWRDYDTAYTERYLGMPETNAAAYDEASLLTYARKAPPGREPSFLLIHGTADDNVYFLNSLLLADALGKSGRAFRFIPFLGQTHQFASADAMEAVWRTAAGSLREGLAATR